jgi:hypothetical protein
LDIVPASSTFNHLCGTLAVALILQLVGALAVEVDIYHIFCYLILSYPKLSLPAFLLIYSLLLLEACSLPLGRVSVLLLWILHVTLPQEVPIDSIY